MDKVTLLQILILKLQQTILALTQLLEKKKEQESIYKTAKSCLGKDMGKTQDELACAESVNAVVKLAVGEEVGGDLSTYRMYLALQKNKSFKRIYNPEQGAIILSPTGFGNGKLKNGHVGIVSIDNKIMSNKSADGLWSEHLDIETWIRKYKNYGGYPVLYYRYIG